MRTVDADMLVKYHFPTERLPTHTQVPSCISSDPTQLSSALEGWSGTVHLARPGCCNRMQTSAGGGCRALTSCLNRFNGLQRGFYRALPVGQHG